MKIFITGGAGFIGSHLTHFHLKNNDSVWVLDNLSTSSLENLNGIKGHPHFRFSQDHLSTWKELDRAIEWADAIYHLAAIVGQKVVITKPVSVLLENMQGCERLLAAMRSGQKKTQRLLIVSSSEVYGPEGTSTFKENADISFPSGQFLQVNYSLSKYVDEALALSYVYEHHLDCVIARLFNTTGPNQRGRYGMVVPRFVQQALMNKPITVYGDGEQSRSFCDVRDCVAMLAALIGDPRTKGEIFNVGNDQEMTILELAHLVKKTTKSSSPIIHIPYEEAYGIPFKDTLRRKPDLTKIRALFDFHPQWTLEQTLDSIHHFYARKLTSLSKIN